MGWAGWLQRKGAPSLGRPLFSWFLAFWADFLEILGFLDVLEILDFLEVLGFLEILDFLEELGFLIFWRFLLLLKLLKLQHAAGFDDGHVLLEVGGLHVGLEGFGAFPGFANHEDFAAGGAFEYVVGDAAFVVELCFGGEGDGGFEGVVVLTLVGLEETIDTDHIVLVFE